MEKIKKHSVNVDAETKAKIFVIANKKGISEGEAIAEIMNNPTEKIVEKEIPLGENQYILTLDKPKLTMNIDGTFEKNKAVFVKHGINNSHDIILKAIQDHNAINSLIVTFLQTLK